jgi:hypothetical protein
MKISQNIESLCPDQNIESLCPDQSGEPRKLFEIIYLSVSGSINSLRKVKVVARLSSFLNIVKIRMQRALAEEQGDVPGWVLVVLMTTGLVTAIWAVAAPRLSSILRNSLDSMNNVR